MKKAYRPLYNKIDTNEYNDINENFQLRFKRRMRGNAFINHKKLPINSTNNQRNNHLDQIEEDAQMYWGLCKKIIHNNKPNANTSKTSNTDFNPRKRVHEGLNGGKHKKYINLQSGGRRLIRYGKQGGKYYIKNNNKYYIK